jgi:hypothetical protein
MTLPEEVITIFLIALHLGQNSLILIRPPNYFIIIISSQSGLEISCGLVLCSTSQPLLRQFVKLIFVTYDKYLGRIQHGFNKMMFFR